MDIRSILIVDDEPRVALFLSKALERLNPAYQVSVAHSGEEALQALNRSQVDLLVTDLRMPGISGLELIRWVRAASPQTRTILITAYGSDDVEAEARRLEASRYITKPFSVDDFARAVEEALRDGAISRPGLVALSDDSFEAIVQQLESLRRDIDARCIFLADMLGQRLAEAGVTAELDAASLLALLAGGFATTGELARQFGGGQAINLNFHEGTHYDIYSANVGDNLFLAILYDRSVQASRIGLVWLYTRRTIEGLLSILSNVGNAATVSTQSLDAGFGASLMEELDTLFPDSASQEETRAEGAIVEERPPSSAPTVRESDEHSDEHQATEGGLLDLDAAIARGLMPPQFDEEDR
jgi:CheY-like chemotaxis protein/predicted regulator of Ras-like GTPase activity (Roadblock/LC7/MglB family)